MTNIFYSNQKFPLGVARADYWISQMFPGVFTRMQSTKDNTGYTVKYRRIKSSYCNCCCRIHDVDSGSDARVSILPGGTVFRCTKTVYKFMLIWSRRDFPYDELSGMVAPLTTEQNAIMPLIQEFNRLPVISTADITLSDVLNRLIDKPMDMQIPLPIRFLICVALIKRTPVMYNADNSIRISTADLHAAFVTWSTTVGDTTEMSQTAFVREISKVCPVKKIKFGNRSMRGIDITLADLNASLCQHLNIDTLPENIS